MYKLIGQNSVKRLADGAYIPFADCNIDYQEYKKWLSEGNIQESEFTEQELAQQELNKRKQEALQYLEDTKWYIERLADPSSGKAVPEDVLAKRAEAREILNELKGAQA